MEPKREIKYPTSKASFIPPSRDTIAKVFVKAIYDYEAQNDDELTIHDEEVLEVIDENDPDWTVVKSTNNSKQGLVPSTYIEVKWLTL